jgi:hypothetical protein
MLSLGQEFLYGLARSSTRDLKDPANVIPNARSFLRLRGFFQMHVAVGRVLSLVFVGLNPLLSR